MKINEDSRGLFVELSKDNDQFSWQMNRWDIKQISYLTINPNFFRGHHYHKETNEAFILLEGDCNLIIFNKAKNQGIEMHLQLFKPYEVAPGEEHTLISRKGAKLVVLSSKTFDPNSPDTFVYENPCNSSDKK